MNPTRLALGLLCGLLGAIVILALVYAASAYGIVVATFTGVLATLAGVGLFLLAEGCAGIYQWIRGGSK